MVTGWLAGWLVESSFDSIFISRFNSISPQLSRSLGRRSASRIASRATRGWRQSAGAENRKAGGWDVVLDAGCSIENHRQPPLPRLPPSRSLRHLEEEIKRAGAQRQDPYTADALLPTSSPPFRRRAARFQPPIHAIPLDTLAMAEGTTPSRETLPSREALGWCGSGGWFRYERGLKRVETVFHSVLLY